MPNKEISEFFSPFILLNFLTDKIVILRFSLILFIEMIWTKTIYYAFKLRISFLKRKYFDISKELKDIFNNFYNDLDNCAIDISNENKLQKFLIKSSIGIKKCKEKYESEESKLQGNIEKINSMQRGKNVKYILVWKA